MLTGTKMRVVELEEVTVETTDIKTLYFHSTGGATPGQFIMVWIPGIDEIPMSLSTIGEMSSVSVRIVGDATKALANLNKGELIGVRGPFGNGYKIEGKNPILIGGGTGIASLTPLVEKMLQQGLKPTFLIGARSSNQLLFKNRLINLLGSRLLISTDDGTEGYHGYASNYASDLLVKGRFDQIYVCGPELMTERIWLQSMSRGIPMQASLERLCKCAIGLCGSCAIGPYRVCLDGPVFNSAMLNEVTEELGKRRMDASGRKIIVDH